MQQPATKSYFFGPGYEQRNEVIKETWAQCTKLGESLTGKFNYTGTNKYAKTLVAFWGWTARSVFSILVTVFMSIMIGVHTAVLAVGTGFACLTACSLRTVDWLWHQVWKIGHPCPANYCPDCSPVYLCPTCGRKHTALRPGVYGVVRRFCECGTSLPTLHHFGRKSLESECSVCGQPLTNVQTSDTHLAFVGGPTSGKTNLFFMALREMAAGYQNAGYSSLSFAEAGQKAFVESQISSLLQGQPAAKTAETAPRAIHIMFKPAISVVPKSVYFYDVAGEAFDSDQASGEHAFYDHIDTIVMVVDPFSIREVAQQYQDRLPTSGVGICPMPPEDAYARMLGALEAYCSRGAAGIRKARLAVAISKVDMFDLVHQIDDLRPTDMPARKHRTTNPDMVRSMACREWLLRNHQDNLVRLVESDFKNVSYFAVSALGRVPSAGDRSGFCGVRVLDPILWGVRSRLSWRGK